MKTLTLPESEIITLADAAKKHGTVELAIAIGIGKSQLYRILRGHNRITPATADKINAWLSTGIPKLKPEKRPSKSRNLATSQSRDLADRPADPVCPSRPSGPERPATAWDDLEFLVIAACKVAEAIAQGRLKNIRIAIDGRMISCGD